MKVDTKRPLVQLAAEVQAGKLTAAALVQSCLDRIEATKEYHAVLEVSPRALERALEIDAAVAAGKNAGRLAGIPFIAKDNFLTHHTHTTAASNILKGFKAPYQATAVERLEAEGAIMVAKANLDAFAHGSSTENSDFGPTKNPWDLTRVAGGSSGGSAAAVAAGLVPLALGTDTGGSVRLPASYCGVGGLKPTSGGISRSGVIAMGSSFDVVGTLTRRSVDAQLALDVMAGRDPLDSTTIEREESYQLPPASLKGLRLGVVKEYLEGVDAAVIARTQAAIQRLEAAGCVVNQVSLPNVDLGLACYYILVPAEVSSNLARYDGIKYGYSHPDAADLDQTYEWSRGEGFGAEAKRRIMIGTYVLSSGYYDAYYRQAQAVRTLLIKEFDQAFNNCDLLISPTAPTPAFKLGQKADDPLAMYLNDVLTVAANIVGSPALSLPSGLVDGLPVGLQLIAPQGQDSRLLAAAATVEELIGSLEYPAC